MRMLKAAPAILLVSLVLSFAGCDRGDKKAGYPGADQPPAPPSAQQQADRRAQLAKPPIKAPTGPVGVLAASFCSAAVGANAQAQAALFNPEFLVRHGLGADNAAKLGDAAVNDLIATTRAETASDIKASRITQVKECEIIMAEVYKPLIVNGAVAKSGCDVAANDAVSRSLEKTDSINISNAMKFMKITDCGLIELREISNSGIEIERLIAGNPGGKWQILLGVKTD